MSCRPAVMPSCHHTAWTLKANLQKQTEMNKTTKHKKNTESQMREHICPCF